VSTLSEKRTISGRGIVSGMQLSDMSEFDDDPLTACAEWYLRFHSLISGYQGDGHTYVNDARSRSLNVALGSVSTTRFVGQPFTIEYQFEMTEGRGVLPTNNDADGNPVEPVPLPSVNPDESSSLATYDLGTEVEVFTETRSDFTAQPVADSNASTSDTPIVRERGQSSAVREWQIRGRVTKNKNQFDADIDSISGDNTLYTYDPGFPGTSFDVKVANDWASTRVAGGVNKTEYGISLTESK
jgi:hypothetical protein